MRPLPSRLLPLVPCALLAAALAACEREAPAPPPAVVDQGRTTHGPIVAELAADRAVLWARTDQPGHWRVVVRGAGQVRRARVPVRAEADSVVKAAFTGLVPASTYEVASWFVVEGGRDAGFRVPEGATRTTFRTAPPPDAAAPVDFVFGSDLAGQNVCRHGRTGFPIFAAMAALEPQFFLALGDMIYADDPCLTLGRYVTTQVAGLQAPAETLGDYRQAWRYTREDPGYAAFLASTPLFAIWDDHEIANDASPASPRFGVASRAFREFNPVVADDPRGGGLYRRIRWGRHLEIFLLDTRSFRAPQAQPDTGEAPKSMLGDAQREWLVRGLGTSDATWKIVASTVPLSIPTGAPEARDGWADGGGPTGYERELVGVLRALAEASVENLLFLSGDVHFAAVHRYRPFEDAPAFLFNEVIVGPLQAGLFPRDELDPTLAPDRRFRYGPDDPERLTGWARVTPWFNFGRVQVDEHGRLVVSVIGTQGNVLYAAPLSPAAPAAGARVAGAPAAGEAAAGEAAMGEAAMGEAAPAQDAPRAP